MHALDSLDYKSLEIYKDKSGVYVAEFFTKDLELIESDDFNNYKDALLNLLEKVR